jgi:hypothetical protein
MRAIRPSMTAVLAAGALALAGCGGSDPVAAPSASPSPSGTTTSSSPSPSTTPTPSSSPSATTSPSAAPSRPRTAAELKKALLTLKDLPTGFQVEPADTSDDDGIVATSTKAGCKSLVRLTNAERAPGSVAAADISLSAGQQGPYIDESIESFRSKAAASGVVSTFRAAVKACRALTLRIPDAGSATVNVAEVSAPDVGDSSFAVRYSATKGPLAGFEVTFVTVAVGDVLVALTFVAAVADDIEGATEAAVTKVKEQLGTSPGSA